MTSVAAEVGDITIFRGFSSSHCWAAKPMKKRNHSVIILVSMVAVAAKGPYMPIEM